MSDVVQRVQQVLPSVRADLEDLVRIQSVWADPARRDEVARSAEAVAKLFSDAGFPEVRIVSEGGAPAVIAHHPAPDGAPTVLLYAHHDVQPEGDPAQWNSAPFEPTERDGRLYGRGTADDKAGIATHLAAIRAFDGKPPVNVVVLVEGEEEMGSPTLARILAEHRDDLEADLYVIADCGNWAAGVPAFTTSLRGVVDCLVEVRTLEHAVHSGQFGGAVPDALTTLCRLLATLHDEQGNVAVAGLVSRQDTLVDYQEATLRAESSLLEGVQPIGSGPLAARTWTKPAISVIGLDTTSIADLSNTLIPSAKARLSVRVAPGDTADNAWHCLKAHLDSHIEWGAQLTVTNKERAEPCIIELSGDLAEKANRAWRAAYGTEPLLIGTGGTIGMIAEFQRAFPDAGVLGTAVADPDSRMHGIDESLYLPDWEAACLAEALLLAELAR